MIILKDKIYEIFTKIEQQEQKVEESVDNNVNSEENVESNVPSEENVDKPITEECKLYVTKECDGNIYVELEKDKYVLEFYDLGYFKDQNEAEIHLYTPHYIDLENKQYGRFKLDSKKLEDLVCKENFTFHNYNDHLEIVNSYKHFK